MIQLRTTCNPVGVGARPSRGRGHGGEYRGYELGLEAKVVGDPETDPDGAGRCRQLVGPAFQCWQPNAVFPFVLSDGLSKHSKTTG